MKTTKNEILTLLKNSQDELKNRFSIVKIGLFGSYAKDCADDSSDIDIYAEFENKKFKNIAGAWNFLEDKLEKKIDLFYPHKNMRETLKKSIESEVVYG
jgi:predicted nucleotidyltransferase